jgi:hypothetical protein
MKRVGLLALAAIAGFGVASPALADWDNIGSIHVDYGVDRDNASPDFGGPVERLQLTATGGDVQCQAIRATYSNGSSSNLFNGMLHQGQSRGVDVPGAAQYIRRLAFTCRSFSHGGANIRIDADVGRYRSQWQASPEWARTWSRLFHWANSGMNNMGGGYSPDNWVLAGTAKFDGPTDRDGGAAGWAGRAITELGFRPVNGDAVCRNATVRFANNAVRNWPVNNGNPMRQGQMYRIDVPGGYRNVSNVMLRCHALGRYAVSINIYGNK